MNFFRQLCRRYAHSGLATQLLSPYATPKDLQPRPGVHAKEVETGGCCLLCGYLLMMSSIINNSARYPAAASVQAIKHTEGHTDCSSHSPP